MLLRAGGASPSPTRNPQITCGSGRADAPSDRSFLSSKRYEVLDQPDTLIEIAEWESAEARAAHMREAAATGVYAPVLELLAAPFRATVIKPLP
jgi:hypothetical protein